MGFISNLFSSNEKGVDHTIAGTMGALMTLWVVTGWAAYNDVKSFVAKDFSESNVMIIGAGGLGKGLRDKLSGSTQDPAKS